MFGELIGLWAASAWHQMGEPENVRLVELGPGRGTMMLDALRAAQVVPAFRAAIVLHLVEVSPKLQRAAAAGARHASTCRDVAQTFDEVPDGPAIVLANEFFDALPINQAIKQFNGWYERVVEIDGNDNLVFGIANEVIPLFDQLVPAAVRDAPVGAIYEWRTDNLALAHRPARGAPGRRRAGRSTTVTPRAQPARPCRRSAGTPSSIRCSRPARSI